MARMSYEDHLQAYNRASAQGDRDAADKHFRAIMKVADQRMRELEKREKIAQAYQMSIGNKKYLRKATKEGVDLGKFKTQKEARAAAQSYLDSMGKLPKNYKHFGGILNYAYKTALHELSGLKYYDARGRVKAFGKRFDKPGVADTAEQQNKLLSVALKFLRNPTSSVQTYNEKFIETTLKFNEKYNTDFTADDLLKFFESTEWQDMQNLTGKAFTSSQILTAVGKLHTTKNPKKMIEAIKKGSEQTLFTDEPIDKAAIKLIKEGKLDSLRKYL